MYKYRVEVIQSIHGSNYVELELPISNAKEARAIAEMGLKASQNVLEAAAENLSKTFNKVSVSSQVGTIEDITDA